MRLLIDQCLSSRLPEALGHYGHDAVHTRELGMRTATDLEILDFACADRRIIISADSDFGELLAFSGRQQPSYVRIEKTDGRSLESIVALLVHNLPPLTVELEYGCIVIIDDHRIRVRALPVER